MKKALIIKTYKLGRSNYKTLKNELESLNMRYVGGDYSFSENIYVSLWDDKLFTTTDREYPKLLYSDKHIFIDYDKLINRKQKLKKLC